MKRFSPFLSCWFFYIALAWGCQPGSDDAQTALAPSDQVSALPLQSIKLPPGFNIEVFAEGIVDARSMALSPGGVLFVGNRSKDKVYALVDEDGDFKADKKYVIASKLNMPCGVAFRDGDLYVAEVNRILRYKGIESRLDNPPAPEVIYDKYPTETHHGWKFIAFGPDGKLYVPVGAPCNICKRDDPVYASVTRLDVETRQMDVFAHGVRNSVGFDWHPGTKDLWFTSNGRDRMGDDVPPDVLNHAPNKDMHFGYPYCHGGNIPDPEFGKQRPCADFTPPAQNLGPHVAALGMRFYTGSMFPKAYQNQIFIAEHGSWNRSKKIGYRITLVTLEGDKAVKYEPFATGWMENEKVWGRPVDVLVMPDGSLLVSDDYAHAIYRISYKG
jgi:glucose/arabinose dehydrogenase